MVPLITCILNIHIISIYYCIFNLKLYLSMGNCDFCHSKSQLQNQPNFAHEAIVFNEYPFRIEGDKLKKKVHRSIGALTFFNKNRKINVGSATLISNNLILTCAHNIYDKFRGSENSEYKFYIGADGVAEKFYEVESWRFPQSYKSKESNNLQFDYALMKLKQPIKFDQYLPLFQSCQQCLLKDNKNKEVMIYGFPSFQQNFVALDEEGKRIKLYQYGLTRKNMIVDVDPLNFKMKYSISTLPGQSGCPVIVDDMIVAVHIGGDMTKEQNVGRLVDTSLLRHLTEWTKELYAAPFNKKQNQCLHQKRYYSIGQNFLEIAPRCQPRTYYQQRAPRQEYPHFYSKQRDKGDILYPQQRPYITLIIPQFNKVEIKGQIQ